MQAVDLLEFGVVDRFHVLINHGYRFGVVDLLELGLLTDFML